MSTKLYIGIRDTKNTEAKVITNAHFTVAECMEAVEEYKKTSKRMTAAWKNWKNGESTTSRSQGRVEWKYLNDSILIKEVLLEGITVSRNIELDEAV